MTFFQFQLGMGYGVRKMTARVWRVFLLIRSTFPDSYPSRYGPFYGSKWPKIIKIFCFWVWNKGCPIVLARGWYTDRLVNSAISWSNRTDRPRSVGMFSLLPLQILSFAQGRKNWSPGPPMTRLRVMGRGIFSTARAFVPVSLRP